MRILTVSDKVEPVLYGPYIRERVGQIDLILACGDLPYYYLEYIVSLLDRPLYYVHGNHDKAILRPSDLNPLSGPPSLGWAVNLHQHTRTFPGVAAGGTRRMPGLQSRCAVSIQRGASQGADSPLGAAAVWRIGCATGVTWIS